MFPGNLQVAAHETHTGMVFLVGDRAYKAKKPVVTDFLDFSTAERRERACDHEVALNRRLAPNSYLGVAHFSDGRSGPPEPVIVMRRHPDACRLATMVTNGEPVEEQLISVAATLAQFHAVADRGEAIDLDGRVPQVAARWDENLTELQRYAPTVVPSDIVHTIRRLADRFMDGRSALFGERIADRRIVDGHADLVADDIFCLDDGPALLDCLEFDDALRHVDTIDDAAFLAMDLEFLGRNDLSESFLAHYRRLSGDPAPDSLAHFYIAYRAVVRAKVDCVRYTQGHRDAANDAGRHLEIALRHLHTGAVRLVLVGGGPGTGKSTLAAGLAAALGASVISTDDVRKDMLARGEISGEPGVLSSGLYAPEQVEAVYNTVLRRAGLALTGGRSVILDGTWRDARMRDRARATAAQSHSPVIELTCAVPLDKAVERVRERTSTASDATPEIAAALESDDACWAGTHRIDTSRPLAESVAQAHKLCCLAI